MRAGQMTTTRRRSTPESLARTREKHASLTETGPVMEAAARFLEARPRSVAETRRRLLRACYPEALVEQVVARLVEVGYLDDEAFARAWVESRDRAHPRGAAALRRELATRGVASDAIAAALARGRAAATGGAAAAGGPTASGESTIPGPAATGESTIPGPAATGAGTSAGAGRRPPATGGNASLETAVTGESGVGGWSPEDPLPDPERVAADRVLARRSSTLLREPDLRRRRDRAYALLVRNGFDPETCRSAVRRWMAAESANSMLDADAEGVEPGDDA